MILLAVVAVANGIPQDVPDSYQVNVLRAKGNGGGGGYGSNNQQNQYGGGSQYGNNQGYGHVSCIAIYVMELHLGMCSYYMCDLWRPLKFVQVVRTVSTLEFDRAGAAITTSPIHRDLYNRILAQQDYICEGH